MNYSEFIEDLIQFYWNSDNAPTATDPALQLVPPRLVGTTSAIARFANRHHNHHIWVVVGSYHQKRNLQRTYTSYQKEGSLIRLMGESEVDNAVIGLLLPPEMIILDVEGSHVPFRIIDMLRAIPRLSETKLLVFG